MVGTYNSRERERERERERMEEDAAEKARTWLEGLSKGLGHEMESLTLESLQVVSVQEGFIRCNFVVPKHLLDKDGNWHVGAMAVLIDNVGAAAIFTSVGHINASVSFDISYYSTAKIHEEVEIEAKVAGHRDKLASVVVKIKRKESGEVIAFSKQWMSKINIPLDLPSKL